ncbi:MAG: exodeoxyribonuclease VII large subunit, partial [Candidatus Neomarinimicrobiota bacterium]
MERTLYSVSDLVSKTRTLLELSFRNVWVEGEVSNVHYHSSGHLYFTIKDSLAELKCVMFKSSNSLMRFQIENGMRIASFGSLSIFEQRGQIQFIIKKIEISGVGTLHQAFESLKNKLDLEGLFLIEKKLKIKKIPKKIGIVTSREGAALKDIMHVLERRSPFLDVVFRSARVQGEGAAKDIANGISELSMIKGMDTIIIGRGGGSIEDLWAF